MRGSRPERDLRRLGCRDGRHEGSLRHQLRVARTQGAHLQALRHLARPGGPHRPRVPSGACPGMGRCVLPGSRGGDRLPRGQRGAHPPCARGRQQREPEDRLPHADRASRGLEPGAPGHGARSRAHGTLKRHAREIPEERRAQDGPYAPGHLLRARREGDHALRQLLVGWRHQGARGAGEEHVPKRNRLHGGSQTTRHRRGRQLIEGPARRLDLLARRRAVQEGVRREARLHLRQADAQEPLREAVGIPPRAQDRGRDTPTGCERSGAQRPAGPL